MAGLAERALKSCMQALAERNRQLAYSVILRDQRIDELEKEIDRLCLEFIVRQQPVAGTLRFAYAAIKINSELERVGDYAESMARQILMLSGMRAQVPPRSGSPRSPAWRSRCCTRGRGLRHPGRGAGPEGDGGRGGRRSPAPPAERRAGQPAAAGPAAARGAGAADDHRQPLRAGGRSGQEHLPGGALHVHRASTPSTAAARCSGCCSSTSTTPAAARWPRRSATRSASRSSSSPAPASSRGRSIPPTLTFLRDKGIDISRHSSKAIDQIPHLDHYQIIVALAKEARRVFPPPPTKVVCLDWSVQRSRPRSRARRPRCAPPTRRPTSSSTRTSRTWSRRSSATPID